MAILFGVSTAHADPDDDPTPAAAVEVDDVDEPADDADDDVADEDDDGHDPIADDEDEAEDEEDDGAASPTDLADDALLDPDRCRLVFGSKRTRRTNRHQRKANLSWVERTGNVVDVTHSTRWRQPFYLEFRGLELVETEMEDGERVGFVHLEDAQNCPSGLYPVHTDDNLGEDARVLAVLPDTLLVEFRGRLGYLLTADAATPQWRMVWRSPWKTIRRYKSPVSVSKGKKKRRSKRRSRRSRRRRRR
ncbi:MAG: hypothetical protein H6704_03775 [Myxococcales bacterium]|nr:hypothetical protein [Myxococcales bacterium]